MNYLKIAKSFKAKKKLGQNFLINKEIIDLIVETASINNEETVIEIGAGLGFVTELLAKKAKNVIAIEIDDQAIERLESLNLDNLQIISEDILKIQFTNLVNSPVKVVANIPYYITTPILLHLIGEVDHLNHENRRLITDLTIMVQKEVGKRITATSQSKNKEWGALSILTNYWTIPELVKEVHQSSFWPRPKVDSVLLKLNIRQAPLINVQDYKYFRRVVKASFTFRRKTLKNALFLSGFSSTIITKALKDINLKETIRGEVLSIEELGALSDRLYLLDQEELTG